MIPTHKSQSKIKYMEIEGDFLPIQRCQDLNFGGCIHCLALWGFRSFVSLQREKEHIANILFKIIFCTMQHLLLYVANSLDV